MHTITDVQMKIYTRAESEIYCPKNIECRLCIPFHYLNGSHDDNTSNNGFVCLKCA